ncbi:hypothetical protein COT97_03765 [Candidatus Falkowbacteria bacterium CG10_big_fil_rev_8_21_14_0_10_39_11]|uniref:Uncharacterized protein n=1 Tax=Candidatus Falkowbacteria bacterium CG10_big_fil_rev_8_21_14_0_10_39_11 TaxID=1974565 RepID=A0A2H0V6M1_9BACT|nr:MAG: hypothetical protein COT97_03765 [Candidatus Falkowbacteria bacterium CG10_big_fil_rev_8_21_14_0_10_39_11]
MDKPKLSTKRKVGVGLLTGPIILLFVTLFLYAITSFIANNLASPSSAFRIFNVLLSLLGILAVIGIVVGVPVGIILIIIDSHKKDSSK